MILWGCAPCAAHPLFGGEGMGTKKREWIYLWMILPAFAGFVALFIVPTAMSFFLQPDQLVGVQCTDKICGICQFYKAV